MSDVNVTPPTLATPALLANLKHQAKAMKNATGEKLRHCQQAIAKNYGYATLAALQAAVKDSPQEVQTPALDQLP